MTNWKKTLAPIFLVSAVMAPSMGFAQDLSTNTDALSTNIGLIQGVANQEASVQATTVPGSTRFGAQGADGVYQEVHVKSFSVNPNYFNPWMQQQLQQEAQQQQQNKGPWVDQDKAAYPWGTGVQLTFQDGVLKTQDPDNKAYPQLDTSRPYAEVMGTIEFESPKQAKSGIYRMDGVVTLMTGDFGSGPFGVNGPLPGYQQSALMGIDADYSPDPSTRKMTGPFNQFGNAKNDHGGVNHVGIVSPSPAPMTVAEFEQAMGSLATVVYPNPTTPVPGTLNPAQNAANPQIYDEAAQFKPATPGAVQGNAKVTGTGAAY